MHFTAVSLTHFAGNKSLVLYLLTLLKMYRWDPIFLARPLAQKYHFLFQRNEVCVSNKNDIITATGDLNFIIKKQSPVKLGTDLI